MNRTVRDRNNNHPKPVKRIELFEKYPKSRLAITILFLLIGIGAFGYALTQYFSVDTGWTTIEAPSSEPSCAEELIFQYYLGAGERSATAEKKAITALYTETTTKAYQLFHTSMSFEEVHNLYYINQHPNQEIVVDPMLYEAFSLINQYKNRAIYLAPVYVQYDNLFGCNDDLETIDFDPRQNQEIATYFLEILSFANNSNAIELELLEENKIKLFVSEAYLKYASENGFSDFIDFYWMKNAFIVDSIANIMQTNGFLKGSISSYDGFTRNLDTSRDTEYAFNIFNLDKEDNTVYLAGVMKYDYAIGIVFLRSYPLNVLDWQHYYEFRDGTIQTAYIDTADGYSKSSVNNLISYAKEGSCAEILLQVIPVFIADDFDIDQLALLAQKGIYSVYCEDRTILYNDVDLHLDLSNKDKVQYAAKYVEK